MYYDWREDVESVKKEFEEFVKADDEALRIINIAKYEKKAKEGYNNLMQAVREVLREEGHNVPFRIGGYRRTE